MKRYALIVLILVAVLGTLTLAGCQPYGGDPTSGGSDATSDYALDNALDAASQQIGEVADRAGAFDFQAKDGITLERRLQDLKAVMDQAIAENGKRKRADAKAASEQFDVLLKDIKAAAKKEKKGSTQQEGLLSLHKGLSESAAELKAAAQ